MATPKAFPIVEQVALTGETLDKVDTVVVTVGGVAVLRQTSVIADAVNPDALGAVLNTQPAGTEYAPVVRALLPSGPIPVSGAVSVSNFPAAPVTQAVSGSVSVSNLPATQPVSATALPLPAGASTEATLAALAGKIGVPASDDVLTLLRSIVTNTGLEVTRADTLELTADQINLNTDQVEAKLDTVNTRLGQIGTAGTLADLLSLVLAKIIAAPATESTLATRTKPSDQQHVIVDSSAAVAVTGPATDVQLRATPLPVSGTVALGAGAAAIGAVSVSNLPATQPVSGSVSVSNLPATQPVSGTVAVSNLPATQAVSGTVALAAGAAAIGAVSVSNFPATQPVSLATNTPDTIDRAARLLGHVAVDATPKGARVNSAVAPASTATLLLAANAARKTALLYNNGTATVYLGATSAVTTANGTPVAAGASISDDSSTGAWYGIMATGTGDVRVVEVA